MKKFAVIFKTIRDLPVPEEYKDVNRRMVDLVGECDGFLESIR